MYSKGNAFLIVLVVLALVGGAVAISRPTTYDQQPTTESQAALMAAVSARDRSTLADIERELGFAQKTGGISPVAYRTLDTKLKALEKKKVNTKTARAILGKLSVGGTHSNLQKDLNGRASAQTSTKQGSKLVALEREITVLANDARPIGPEHYARLKAALDAETRAGANQTTIRKLLVMLGKVNPDNVTSTQSSSPASAPKENCNETPPVLTADITDFSKIQKITAPGTASSEGPKGHSFIWTAGARVPIYAPVAGIYNSGSYSKDTLTSKAQYLMFFRVKGSCGYQFKFDHIDEPIAAIRVQLPSVPKVADSRGTPATTPVEFKAGELIGYTSGNVPSGNWDFGLYNTKREGKLAAQGSYGIHRNSVCWVDFYTANKKAAYRRLLEGPELVCSLLASESDAGGSVGSGQMPQMAQPVAKTGGDSEPPLLLKGIGINLDYFDPATGRAGDVVFTREKLQFNVPFTEFGFVIPANMSASGANKSNPQPTFELPMGTKVRSLVDGVVVEMPTLYSGDYSIMVAPSANSNWRYETEHVINPLVKVGDRVTAGQVIAEVSPHNKEGNSGFGLVEIGILHGGKMPEHLCPFAYLDASIKDDVQKKLRALYKSWEDYRGDTTLYNEAAQAAVPGCLTLAPIEG